ncbi:uncharacterized protein JCM6883_005235 [Sporobolomyces salmoneus]|uniref:uncharacterized protein n=1 Tax=Sporobolomyces salmoneus TaxID=183962 RepID=UPI00317A15F2
MSSWLPSLPFTFSVPWPSTPEAADQTPMGDHAAESTPPFNPAPSTRHRFPSPPPRGTELGNASKRGRTAAGSSEEGEEEEPDRKRRKRGIVGTVLGTVLDAAVISTAMGYSAYQLWKHPPSKDDVDALAQRKQLMLADRPHSDSAAVPEAPPPYSELVSSQSASSTRFDASSSHQPSPSQIPRRIRRAHEPRPRTTNRNSSDRLSRSPGPSGPSVSAPNLNFDSDPFVRPFTIPSRDPLANLSSGPLPEFQPFSSPKFGSFTGNPVPTTQSDDEDDLEDDEEMKAVSDRLKSLIETGREALASRPREWSHETSTTSLTDESSRSRLSTTSSLTSATTVGASPKIPSPLSQFTSRFDSPQSHSLPSSPRNSLPNPTSIGGGPRSTSLGHSRRKSLDTFSRIPTSDSSLHSPSSSKPACHSASSGMSRGHRHTQSFTGISASQSLPSLNEGGEEVVDEFEKVLQKARKSRDSLGGR